VGGEADECGREVGEEGLLAGNGEEGSGRVFLVLFEYSERM